ncbi:MAG: hypothetical protein CVT48_03300 [Thermoplasmata archaeon HGW-Thermoplasmata-1]|nr:MAG: hypothetical protein CVT48_03300 [Thermoplasmata archaeon HGW-Thermoplasmata-1]
MSLADRIVNIFDTSNPVFWVLVALLAALALFKVIRPFIFYAGFVYPNAKFAAIGHPFIGKRELDRIIDANGLDEYRTIINQVRGYELRGETARELQNEIDSNFAASVLDAAGDMPKAATAVTDAFGRILDGGLIERAVRAAMTGREVLIPGSPLIPQTMELIRAISSVPASEVGGALRAAGFGDAVAAQVEGVKEFDEAQFSVALTADILSNPRGGIPKSCRLPLRKFVKLYADVENVKSALRAKQLGFDPDYTKKLLLQGGWEISPWLLQQLAEVDSVTEAVSQLEGTSYIKPLRDAITDYEKEGSLRPLEKALDGYFITQVVRISVEHSLTIGPLLRYLVSRAYEVRNLKAVAKGIEERVDRERLRELMVMEVTV